MDRFQVIRDIIVDPDNPNELVLDLGTELCERLGWKPGDVLEWTNQENGTWRLQKVQSPTP
jgi:hypothetical protein